MCQKLLCKQLWFKKIDEIYLKKLNKKQSDFIHALPCVRDLTPAASPSLSQPLISSVEITNLCGLSSYSLFLGK